MELQPNGSTHKSIDIKAAIIAAFIFCDPDWIRTNGLQLRRLLLYPAELPDQTANGG